MIRLQKCIIHLIAVNYIYCFVCGYDTKIFKQHNMTILNKIVVDIIKSCYAEHDYILLYNESKEDITEYLWSRKLISILIDFRHIKPEVDDKEEKVRREKEFVKKVNGFLFAVNSFDYFYNSLKSLQGSLFWNVMIPIFVTTTSPGGCSDVKEFFEITWTAGYLTSILLCLDSEEKPMLYTYNPYTNRAPLPWRVDEEGTGTVGQWTLYKRPYSKDSLCDGLNFDRMRFLDGTTVNIIDLKKRKWETQGEASFINFFEDAIIFSLNVTSPDHEDKLHRRKNSSYESDSNRFITSPIDIYFLLSENYWKSAFRGTYPVKYSGTYILTHQRGYFSPMEKIYHFYGFLGIIATLIILMITFIVILWSTKKSRIAFAAFEILRLLVNTSIYIKMNTLSLKIFFAMIFLYFLIIQATFQGNLAKFLTKPELKKNVDSLEDFVTIHEEYPLFIRGSGVLMDVTFTNLGIRNFSRCSFLNCIDSFLNNTNSALLEDYTFAVQHAVQYNLYLSRKSIESVKPLHFIVRQDWPVAQRVDKVLMWMEHSGLSERWSAKWIPDKEAYQRMQSEQLEISPSPITMNTLKFAFQFLGFGLICAFACFIIEKLIEPLQSFCTNGLLSTLWK